MISNKKAPWVYTNELRLFIETLINKALHENMANKKGYIAVTL